MNHKEWYGAPEEKIESEEMKQRRRNSSSKATCALKRHNWRKRGSGRRTDAASHSFVTKSKLMKDREWPENEDWKDMGDLEKYDWGQKITEISFKNQWKLERRRTEENVIAHLGTGNKEIQKRARRKELKSRVEGRPTKWQNKWQHRWHWHRHWRQHR